MTAELAPSAVSADPIPVQAAAQVDQDRLWRRHEIMARFGARPDGGVNRQAFSDDEAHARTQLERWTSALGLQGHVDPITNLFFRLEGRRPDLAPVLVGSHIDSQPAGGRFDGIYGVLAGLEALEAIRAAGITPRRPIELVAWVNEEGSSFSPGMTGSAVFAGAEDLESALQHRNWAGETIAERIEPMLRATPLAHRRSRRVDPFAYLEAHIEQGPQLEAADVPVGIVTGIQGARWFDVEVTGEAAHAGTTPLGKRRDALSGAVRMIERLEAHFWGAGDPDMRFTVGRVEVGPGAPNTVPERVFFTIDFRHPDREVLSAFGDAIEPICWDQRGRCAVRVVETQHSAPVTFPEAMTDRLARAAGALAIPSLTLPSGANHDAKFLAGLCPTAMLFIPCRNGVSHNPEEWAEPVHVAAGARVLTHALVDLAAA